MSERSLKKPSLSLVAGYGIVFGKWLDDCKVNKKLHFAQIIAVKFLYIRKKE